MLKGMTDCTVIVPIVESSGIHLPLEKMMKGFGTDFTITVNEAGGYDIRIYTN